MQLRVTPSLMHKRIGFYPGNPRFDPYFAEMDQLAEDLYHSLIYAGITITHKVYIPWAVGYVDVTDPNVWNNDGLIRCYWLTRCSSIVHDNKWAKPDSIIFEQIIDI